MAPWMGRRGSQPQVHQGQQQVQNPNSSFNSIASPNSDLSLVGRIHTTALHTPTTLPGHFNGSRRFDIANVHADSSSDDDDADFRASKPSSAASSKSRRPTHARSMSQPFPSLFSSKKKRQNSVGPDLGFADDDVTMPRPNPVKGHTRGGGPGGSKDFATGNCMTCGSLVRWPRDLKVFKCTICASVNDLVPLTSESQGNGNSRVRRDSSQGPSGGMPSRVHQISVDQTRRIVRQCILSHLSQRLGQAKRRTPEKRCPERSNMSFSARVHAAGSGMGLPDPNQEKPSAFHSSPPNYVPQRVFAEGPSLRVNQLHSNKGPMLRSYSSSYSERPAVQNDLFGGPPNGHQRTPSKSLDGDPKRIFKSLEDYIVACFESFECVNSSFMIPTPRNAARRGSEPLRRKPVPPSESRASKEVQERRDSRGRRDIREQRDPTQPDEFVPDLDPKLLLIGDFAENGTWWTGQDESLPSRTRSPSYRGEKAPPKSFVATKSPQINREELASWYALVTNTAEGWLQIYDELSREEGFQIPQDNELQAIERDLLQAQEHTRRVLMKATELLLKRPGRLLMDPADMRFLLIILENPLLHLDCPRFRGVIQTSNAQAIPPDPRNSTKPGQSSTPTSGPLSGQHSGILKRLLGLISNSSIECHNQLITWLARYHKSHFVRTKELVSGFLTYRLLRQRDKKHEVKVDITAGLIPQMHEGRSGAYLLDEISESRQQKKPKEPPTRIAYAEDWQIKAASRVLALLFAANNLPHVRRGDDNSVINENNLGAVRDGVHAHGQILPTSDFYSSLVDYADLVADFDNWENRRGKFSFCQYPFLLSISAKTRILEHDARRQMESKARDAFFDSIMSRRNVNQFLLLDIRRDCLVEDSLKAVSEVVGSGSEDVKKGLRINFKGEEGIDAGGLRKEWFLLLVREVFNPDHGMFLYDEDSQYCYFNHNSFETSDQFFLVGVVMGLAIYNSTILDVALPPFAFRKLIASAPSFGTGNSAHPRPTMRYTLDDLAEYRPRVAKSLQQLLDYEGDVEETFCLDFVIEMDKYGSVVQAPLCPGGDRIPVTNSNRREYVELYVRHLLDVAVTRQFEPFKRGFYTICGGNALSLFRPEEIELLVRGSDEALDISSLRAVAEYDNWGKKKPDGQEPLIDWFWETFQEATPKNQRKLLLFITGSDRIPATGATVLPIKISYLGDESDRFPIARTCFNLISLWKYETKEKLEQKLWTAVHESEGFGLK